MIDKAILINNTPKDLPVPIDDAQNGLEELTAEVIHYTTIEAIHGGDLEDATYTLARILTEGESKPFLYNICADIDGKYYIQWQTYIIDDSYSWKDNVQLIQDYDIDHYNELNIPLASGDYTIERDDFPTIVVHIREVINVIIPNPLNVFLHGVNRLKESVNVDIMKCSIPELSMLIRDGLAYNTLFPRDSVYYVNYSGDILVSTLAIDEDNLYDLYPVYVGPTE